MSSLKDPRVFFAAERTLLAWTRTSLALMAFGFVVERFGMFVHILFPQHSETLQQRGISFWIGLSFIILGALSSTATTIQYQKVLKSLQPAEIPDGYPVYFSALTNLIVGALGVALTVYLFLASSL